MKQISNLQEEYTRQGAVSPGTFVPVLIWEGKCLHWRAKSAHLGGHLPILAKPYWNKGIMSEALAAILQFGFDSCRLHRFEAHVALPNHASAQVLRKLGFQEEGLLRESLYVDNQFYDEKMFALLKKR